MKKVLLIVLLCFSCYFIYNKTINKKVYYLTIGDALSKGVSEYGVVSYGYSDYIKDYFQKNKKLEGYNKTYTSADYRVIDIIKSLEYNEKKDDYSLNRLIKKADVITISLGMNELYYKLNNNNQNIYTYIDTMINNYSKILKYINNFHHDHVYVLGFYNSSGANDDIFSYANYKLKEICQSNNSTYIDLSSSLSNNPMYLSRRGTYIPSPKGYEKISQIIVENLKNN